jgi:tetratricopeptide (TPR) repeat protein
MTTEVNKRADVTKALEEADNYRMDGDYEKGISVLSDALAHGVEQSQIYYRLGNIYFDSKKYEHAEYSFRRAIDHDSLHVNAHYNLGVVYKKMGRIDEGMKMRKKANKIARQHPEKVKVSSEQIATVRSFARKLLFFGIGFIVLIIVALFVIFSLVSQSSPEGTSLLHQILS